MLKQSSLIACALAAAALLSGNGAKSQTGTWPATLRCAPPTQHMSMLHGIDDNFAVPTPADPAPTPGAGLIATYGAPMTAPSNKYDNTAVNYHFGDTFAFPLPAGTSITAARVTTRIRPNGDIWNNDSFNFQQQGAKAEPVLGNMGYHTPGSSQLISFDITSSGISPAPSYGTTGNPSQALAALNANQFLNFYMQDDSEIDFIALELCVTVPPPKDYDIGVNKQRDDRGGYIIRIANPGRPLPAGAKVEMTELVPAGLTVGAVSAPAPWSCALPVTPLVGPDSFVCTYIVPAAGIPTGGALPTISLRTTGQPECTNCARVRLYLPGIIIRTEMNDEAKAMHRAPPSSEPITAGPRPSLQGWHLIAEPNMANNVSCTR